MKIDIKVITPENFKGDVEDLLPVYNEHSDYRIDLKGRDLKRLYSGTREVPIKVVDKTLDKGYFNLRSFERALIGTGLIIKIPKNYELQIRSKSDLTLKKGLLIIDSPNIIDCNYTEEVCFAICNITNYNLRVNFNEVFAQGVLCPIVKITEWGGNE